VAIHKWKYQAHNLARKLNGRYSSMEEVEGLDLINACRKLEQTNGCDRALAMIEFAGNCLTHVSTELTTIKERLKHGDTKMGRISKNANIATKLAVAAGWERFEDWSPIMNEIENIQKAEVFRPELWHDMKKASQAYKDRKNEETLEQIAREIRQLHRSLGRFDWKNTVSRVLLIKGLEYDNAIILDADALSTNELYVALTRPKNSLIILSKSRTLISET
jgi:DNA helicase-2/ATP-dependent DNA helicase PcrA